MASNSTEAEEKEEGERDRERSGRPEPLHFLEEESDLVGWVYSILFYFYRMVI